MCRWLSALKRCITVVDDEKLLGTTLVRKYTICFFSYVLLNSLSACRTFRG